MRIIAGTKKGIKLKMVPGRHVRPTSSRVKESIFQILGPYFEGGMALDLFAGSGQIGLEGLSRGLDYVIFVDHSVKSIQTIRQNIRLAHMEAKASVIKMNALAACRLLGKKKQKMDYIFVDPPYGQKFLLPVLQEISNQHLLTSFGKVVVECANDETIPAEVGKLIREFQRSYGDTCIMIYQQSILGSKEEPN